MPLIEVKLFETRLEDRRIIADLVEGLTNALCEVLGEDARPDTWVVLHGIPPGNWGIGGKTSA